MPLPPTNRLRPETLEDRVVQAFNLTIDGNAISANVSNTLLAGTRTFTATGSGATLDVDDIETALNAGENVVITTGASGAEAGLITWGANDGADHLDYSGSTVLGLTILIDASATALGGLLLDQTQFYLNDNLNLTFDVSAAPSANNATLQNDVRINNAQSVNFVVDGALSYNSNSTTPLAVSGDVLLSVGSFQPTAFAYLASTFGNIDFNGPIDLSGAGLNLRAENGLIDLDAVDGANDLTLYGTSLSLDGNLGGVTPLTTVTFSGGQIGANNISAATINIGDGLFDNVSASLGNAGGMTGNVVVDVDGELAPGGVGVVGLHTITGNLIFNGGGYDVDLGPTIDLVQVTGDVSINSGDLRNGLGSGALAGIGNFPALTLTGTMSGNFTNAPLNTGLLLGADAVQVTNYGPTQITLAQRTANPGGLFNGTEADGTGYAIRLTGGGELQAFTDAFGQLVLATRNTTAKSKLSIRTTANASNDLVTLNGVLVRGDLGMFDGAKAILVGPFTAVPTNTTTGALKTLAFNQLFGDITTPGNIGSIAVKVSAATGITANSLSKMTVGLNLFGTSPWAITNNIGALTAGRITALDVTANALGTLTVKGDKKLGVSGDVLGSQFTLTGNDGTAKQIALKTVAIAGTVDSTTFDIQEGNVGAMTVGRFLNSNMYLDYTPGTAFDTDGSFDSATAFKLGKFTTTAKTIGDVNNPYNFAFAGSQIVADTIGSIALTGLQTANNGLAMGLKFRTAGGVVRTKSADSGTVLLNANLTPSGTALANDFFFLDI